MSCTNELYSLIVARHEKSISFGFLCYRVVMADGHYYWWYGRHETIVWQLLQPLPSTRVVMFPITGSCERAQSLQRLFLTRPDARVWRQVSWSRGAGVAEYTSFLGSSLESPHGRATESSAALALSGLPHSTQVKVMIRLAAQLLIINLLS
jgi:hypothetical protein